jgi:hypothetical protein
VVTSTILSSTPGSGRPTVSSRRDGGSSRAELVRELVVAEAGVDRNDHRAQPRGGQRARNPLRPVGQVDGDPVTRFDPEIRECRRQRADFAACLGVGRAPLSGNHDQPARIARDGGVENIRQMGRNQGRAPGQTS